MAVKRQVQHIHPASAKCHPTTRRNLTVRTKKPLEILLSQIGYDHETENDLGWNMERSAKDLRWN